ASRRSRGLRCWCGSSGSWSWVKCRMCRYTWQGGEGMILDLFAGPGGWDEGLRMIGRTDVTGVEWDEEACATAEAAGHARIHMDVRDYSLSLKSGGPNVEGIVASPPCQPFSENGKRGG